VRLTEKLSELRQEAKLSLG